MKTKFQWKCCVCVRRMKLVPLGCYGGRWTVCFQVMMGHFLCNHLIKNSTVSVHQTRIVIRMLMISSSSVCIRRIFGNDSKMLLKAQHDL